MFNCLQSMFGVPDILLMVPLKTSTIVYQEGGQLHERQARLPAAGRSGRTCKIFTFIVVVISCGL